MTDKEIIVEALEHCVNGDCGGCPNLATEYCSTPKLFYKDTLDLINRQQAKIEALQMDKEQLESDVINANMNLEHITAEIERLEKERNYFKDEHESATLHYLELENQICKLKVQLHRAKAEAIKEFADRLADVFCNHDKGDTYVREVINNIVKEMVGEDK